MSMEELCRHIGETVTIFTASGGVSGCGFTGILLRVNPCYVTLVNRIGSPPASPFTGPSCMDRRDCKHTEEHSYYNVGSVCDIPVEKIVSFCHNAI